MTATGTDDYTLEDLLRVTKKLSSEFNSGATGTIASILERVIHEQIQIKKDIAEIKNNAGGASPEKS